VRSARKSEVGHRSKSLEARIYTIYSSLSPAEKRLADVLLQHQMELPSYTAGELAEKAAVSKATAARLIRSLGYTTYPEAKRQIRMEQHWGSPLSGLADTDQAPSDTVSLFGRLPRVCPRERFLMSAKRLYRPGESGLWGCVAVTD
jgi:hypothetical protein